MTAISALELRIAARVATAMPSSMPRERDEGDELLRVNDVAARLGLKPKTVYHNARRYPFFVDLDGQPRFSRKGLERWLEMKQNPRARVAPEEPTPDGLPAVSHVQGRALT
jgi:hypothetical protein